MNKIIRILIKKAQDATQDLTRWGFHHMEVIKFIVLQRHTMLYVWNRYVFIWRVSQNNDYQYGKYFARNKDVHQAVKNVEISSQPLEKKISEILKVNVYLPTHRILLLDAIYFQCDLIFQQYQIKYQTIWVNESNKVSIVNSFLKKYFKLYDIRHGFDQIKSITSVIDAEPSNVVVGPIEINLGTYLIYLKYFQ